MNQKKIDVMAYALRVHGLTWSQTNFAVALARNAIAAAINASEGVLVPKADLIAMVNALRDGTYPMDKVDMLDILDRMQAIIDAAPKEEGK